MFFTSNGHLVRPSVINSHFKKLCKDADIRVFSYPKKKGPGFVNCKTSDVHTHMLRHTFATRCIESGMSAVVLSRYLGHRDIETTLNTYTDVFNRYKKDELLVLENYLNGI